MNDRREVGSSCEFDAQQAADRESPLLWISACAIGAAHVPASAEALAWYALESGCEPAPADDAPSPSR